MIDFRFGGSLLPAPAVNQPHHHRRCRKKFDVWRVRNDVRHLIDFESVRRRNQSASFRQRCSARCIARSRATSAPHAAGGLLLQRGPHRRGSSVPSPAGCRASARPLSVCQWCRWCRTAKPAIAKNSIAAPTAARRVTACDIPRFRRRRSASHRYVLAAMAVISMSSVTNAI